MTLPLSPRARVAERAFLVLAWLLIAYLLVWHGLVFPLSSPSADYGKHWYAAVAILHGESPYKGPDLYLGFNYPMLTGFLFLHLAAFSLDVGETVWEITNFLFVIAGALVLVWGFRPGGDERNEALEGTGVIPGLRSFLRRHWLTTVFLLVANYQPLHRVLIASNLEPLNMLLGAMFVAFAARRRDTAAGITLTVFALTKLAPVFILIPLVAMRRWRIVFASLGAFAVYGLFLLVTGYWRTELFLYTDVVPRIPFTYMDLSCSLHRFAASVLDPAILENEEAYKGLVFKLNVVMMLVYLGIVALWMRLKHRDPLVFLAWGCFMVLPFTPLLEINHFVWVTGAVFLQLHAWRTGRMSDIGFVMCVACWVGIMNLAWVLSLPRALGLNIPTFYPQTFILVVVLALSGAVAFMRVPGEEDVQAHHGDTEARRNEERREQNLETEKSSGKSLSD
ncbi:MAG: hypothetical protein PWP23_1965 [Candidatus Sumerlaeota bacterium]|nr:hypothetical protein [Candidatus Sumerlaeota bacterium]